MSKIDHPAVKKAVNGKVAGVVAGILLLVLAAVSACLAFLVTEKAKSEAIYFGTAYNEGRLEDDIYVFVEIADEPYEFAYQDNGPSYYFIWDDDNTYIMKGYESDYNEIVEGIDRDGYYDVIGTIQEIEDEEVLEFALEAYNEGETDPERIVSKEDFDSYFQSVAINPNANNGAGVGLYVVAFLLLVFGLICLIAAGLELMHYNKFMNGLDEYQAQYITNELYNPQTIYIKKCRVYLASTCIISLGNKLEVVPYNNILWAYRFNQSYNFVPTITNITIMKKDFKTVSIADMPGMIPGKQDIINQIFAVIQARNPQALIGYSDQNQNYVNQLKTSSMMQNRQF